MRCREHRPGSIERTGGVVQQVGRAEPEVDHVEPLLHRTASELGDELLARLAHVASDQHTIGVDEAGEPHAEGVGDLTIQLVGHRPPDVVGLDDLIQN